MSRSATLRQVLAEIMQPYQGHATAKPGSSQGNSEGPRVKFLISNAIIEGTVALAHNPKLLTPSPYTNGHGSGGEDFDVILLTDVAIRPLNEPEVHVGVNKLQLFLEAIIGLVS